MSSDSPNPKAPEVDTPATGSRTLLKKSAIVSGMTLSSRILGLIRDVVFARMFGASLVMDAFLVANRIPNMLRRFFAEGAFSQGFVPVMARYRERHSEDEAREFAAAIAGTLGLVLFIVTLVGVIAAPLLVAIVAPGFIGDNGRFDLATLMLRFTFPYLFFVSLTAFAGGLLNTYGRFAVPAFTPVLLNVTLISFAIWLAPTLEEPGMALAYAVLVAGIVQLAFQLPFLKAIRMLDWPRWRPMHEGVRRVVRLMVPAIFGSSVAQLNILVGGILASLLGVGKISLLYYADRLMEFPLGIFGIALATVTLPYLSRQHATESRAAFSATLDWSMRLVLLISLPAAVGLTMLAEPLVATIFYGGAFTGSDVQLAGLALQAFSIGLIGFSYVKILAPAYFAREDTVTPVRVGLIALLVNFLLSVALAWYLTRINYPGTHAGLALATSVAALLNAALLYRGLNKEGVFRPESGWTAFLLRVVVANAAMCVILFVLGKPLDWWLQASFAGRVVELAIVIGAGAGTYLAILIVIGLRPAHLGMRPH
jgi:putative peptidoglycan lipid II flippase